MYKISFADRVQEDLERLSAHEPAAFNKVVKMLNELAEHPRTGTGHPEPLKGQPEGRKVEQAHNQETPTCVPHL